MRKILIIIQRSNGDVLLSSPLIESLYQAYKDVQIDILVNDDTYAIAKILPHIHHIHLFSYARKKEQRLRQEKDIIQAIYKKYDLSINLTASDRSVMYAILASSYAISAVEEKDTKSWWKRLLLKHSYPFDATLSIIQNNVKSLAFLGIDEDEIKFTIATNEEALKRIKHRLEMSGIEKYIIFHPSAQYDYKIYPQKQRNMLLEALDTLGISMVITGAKSDIDMKIKETLPKLPHVYDWIGETTLDEYIALSALSEGYVGMDTLNMHIAAAQNKRIFAILGPTLLSMWSPWCNALQKNAQTNMPMQTYGNITLFQADMPCVACGLAGCDDNHGMSECLYQIPPKIISQKVSAWLTK